MIENPYHYGASHILQRIDPQNPGPRAEVMDAARELLVAMGSPISPPVGIDNGTLALVLFCQFLREHGASIAAVTKAHNELHQS